LQEGRLAQLRLHAGWNTTNRFLQPIIDQMRRYKPPSLLQALNIVRSAHQELEGIFRDLDAELAKAKEVSKTLDEAVNCIKGYNLRDSDYMPLHESMVAIRSAANVIRKTVRRQASGIDYLKMAANLIETEIVKHVSK